MAFYSEMLGLRFEFQKFRIGKILNFHPWQSEKTQIKAPKNGILFGTVLVILTLCILETPKAIPNNF